jgi:hypothetical protein
MENQNFQFTHNAHLIKNLKPIQWRIEGIMEDDTLYNDFGDVASFKTFVAIDRGLHVASRKDYHGHRVKQGTVFYIAGEGQQGIGRRIAAWHIHHGTRAEDVPFFVARTVTDLMDPKAIDDVKRAVDKMAAEYGPPAIVHLDTLSRNFGAGDENATKDMNRAINNLCSGLGNDIIKGITHHTGHSNKERARGSIALRAASDHEYRISYRADIGKVLVECRKMKDAPLAPPMLFRPKEILVQIGDQRCSSCVLELDSEGNEARIGPVKDGSKVSKQMKTILDVLRQIYSRYEKNLADSGREGQMPNVAVGEWREECLKKGIYTRPDAFNRAAESLTDRGYTVYDESEYYVYPTEIKQKYETNEQ